MRAPQDTIHRDILGFPELVYQRGSPRESAANYGCANAALVVVSIASTLCTVGPSVGNWATAGVLPTAERWTRSPCSLKP